MDYAVWAEAMSDNVHDLNYELTRMGKDASGEMHIMMRVLYELK